ncbi:F0F1 ATP synthase subunit A [Tenacibaculum piscium]|uniref:ATP synthase subunit a n=2 Tax=Tenacibaculum piscium TaxID=1458515 RepID=A0A2H1YKM7_9FLAO|nr:F0F1 ATP synthase subunit A [Tenacibaculum piscium]MBE7629239.1 F0F1 ATP synthase subunit A [Tenacibaculum piscium]MBE7670026.1 F0F1 ATP synthase subunit A [Tenacibaculum piscium]MBE7685549.1 F0F1 ATP synthase subunit A [Tenacibaculum piscium]MBE7690133.1 F0F1 ATP synthase subunit A [Tenacibaculum piscium]MCG8183314.1 F0F1 ATP synthase subunit A [Tenacibaculum piscium]
MMIATKSIKFLTILALVFISFSVFAEGGNTTLQESEPVVLQDDEHAVLEDGGRVNTKEEIEAYKKHHLADSHDFSLFSYTNDQNERKHVGFALPVIVWTSKGLKTFMSSAFHHNDDGHVVVTADDVQLTKIHSKIYELNEGETAVSFDEAHHATNAHKVIDFSITKSVFGMFLVGLLMIFGFRSLAKGYKKGAIPTGFARVLEPLVLYVRDEIARPNIGEKHYRKFMGFLLTVFFFIWISNLLGLTPLGFNITGQLAVTVCLALFTFFIVQFSANKDYWKHIFWMPGVPVVMKFVLAPIEFLGILTKPFSLFVRLFANITAGHSVVMGIAALMIVLKAKFGTAGATSVSIFLTLFLTLIEVLVAFLQAYIFTMLSSLFIGMAVEEHEHH